MSNVYFTADPHFDHENIIKYCNRPYKSVDEMNESLVANWNSKITDNDVCYVCGDFTMHSKNAQKWLKRLAGTKILIQGNHDKNPSIKDGWKSIHDIGRITIEKQFIVLCHYPMKTWERSFHGSWMLFGHEHGNIPDDKNILSFDVGVDCHNYFPISFQEVKAIMAKKSWTKPSDRVKEL